MKAKSPAIVALLLALGLFTTPAQAQLELSTSVFAGSPYVWRGEVLSTGWVFQPTITASYGGFSASYFGNIDPNSQLVNNKFHVQESDLILAYNAALGDLSLGVGYTFYTFPTPTDDELELLPTQEFFASLAYAAGPVTPSVFVAYDFDENDTNALQGLYGEAKLGYGLDVGGQTYGLAATLGLDSGYYQKLLGDDETSISHLALTAGTDFSAGNISIAPLLGFQFSLDDTYKDAFGKTFFYGGFTVGL